MPTTDESPAVALHHLVQIGTRRERVTGAGQHHHGHRRVGAGSKEGIGGSVVQRFVEGVANVGTIKCERPDATRIGGADQCVAVHAGFRVVGRITST